MKFLRKIQNLNQRFSFFALAINGIIGLILCFNKSYLLYLLFPLFFEGFLLTLVVFLIENAFGLKIKKPKIINSRFLNILGIIGAISAILILTWFFILLISL